MSHYELRPGQFLQELSNERLLSNSSTMDFSLGYMDAEFSFVSLGKGISPGISTSDLAVDDLMEPCWLASPAPSYSMDVQMSTSSPGPISHRTLPNIAINKGTLKLHGTPPVSILDYAISNSSGSIDRQSTESGLSDDDSMDSYGGDLDFVDLFETTKSDTEILAVDTGSQGFQPMPRDVSAENLAVDPRSGYHSSESHSLPLAEKEITPSVLTLDDAESYKTLIEQLYIKEGLKLRVVMQILESRFGFQSTVKIYKKLLKEWGFRKNCKAEEWENLARRVQACHNMGRPRPPLIVKGQSVKIQGLRRYLKDKKLLEKLCPCLLITSPSDDSTPSSHFGSFRSNSVDEDLKLPTGIAYDVERSLSTTYSRTALVLSQTEIYMLRCSGPNGIVLQGSTAQRNRHAAQTAFCMRDKLVNGVGILVQALLMREKLGDGQEIFVQWKFEQGYEAINKCWPTFCEVLGQQYQGLVRLILEIFTDAEWVKYRELETQIHDLKVKLFRVLTLSSIRELGVRHPLSIVLFHLQETDVLEAVVDRALSRMIAMFEEDNDSGHKATELWRLKTDYCYLWRSRKEFAIAEESAQLFLTQAELWFHPFDPFALRMLRELASIHHEQGYYQLAQSEFEDLLRRASRGLGSKYPDDTCVYALRGLAQIHDELGDFTESERCWQTALKGAIKEFGADDEETTLLKGKIEEFLIKNGRDPVAWFQNQGNFSIYGI